MRLCFTEHRNIQQGIMANEFVEVKRLPELQAVYEEPTNPEVIVNTDRETVDECVRKIMEKIEEILRK